MYMAGIHDRKIRKNENDLLDSIWAGLQDSPADFSPEEEDLRDIRDRIMKKRRKTAGILSAAGIAAALFFMIFIPAWFRNEGSGEDSPVAKLRSMGVSVSDEQVSLKMDDDSSGRMLRLDVPSGKQFSLKLADGTSVWLNSESSIEYPASFDGCQERTVRLSGEAFFDVVKDPDRPFIVELGNGESIRVLGTSFNVDAYPDNESNVTTLVSGKISYRQEAAGRDLVLVPDQQISVDRSDGSAEIQPVETSASVDWRGRMITFEDEKLPSLARRLSRMYGIEIIVGEHLSEYAFSGRISYDKGVDFITRLMKETSGITCEIKDGKIYLD